MSGGGLIAMTSCLSELQEFEQAEGEAKTSGMVLSPTDAPSNATTAVEVKDPGRTPEQVTQADESTSQGEREGFFGLLDKLSDVNCTQVLLLSYVLLRYTGLKWLRKPICEL
jgi:hypothetical protein